MNIRTGIDIIEVNRIKEAIENLGKTFLERIYTKEEIEYCSKRGVMSYQHYAARFAAKEAVFKAISGILKDSKDITWNKIEIKKQKDGKPYIELVGINLPKIKQIDLSMSHIKEYAVANVVLIIEE